MAEFNMPPGVSSGDIPGCGSDQEIIDAWEEETGLVFDPEGPSLDVCEHCGDLFQFVVDHDCNRSRCESVESTKLMDQ